MLLVISHLACGQAFGVMAPYRLHVASQAQSRGQTLGSTFSFAHHIPKRTPQKGAGVGSMFVAGAFAVWLSFSRRRNSCAMGCNGKTADIDQGTMNRIAEFCRGRNIRTTGVLAMTIHLNRTSSFASLVVNMESLELLPNYPAEVLTQYKEIREGSFIVCYHEDLKVPSGMTPAQASISSVDSAKPFCCNDLTPYKPRRLDWEESYFKDFMSSKGTRNDVVFEVRAQVDNGPLLSTRYFALESGKRILVHGEFSEKTTGYKNYKCSHHKRFYAVNMYRRCKTGGSNYHHMRVVPFTKINPAVISRFLSEMGV